MILTDAQLRSELRRCEFCEEKPCKTACPCDCSPADFIMAARGGKPSDYKRSAGMILASNPLGGVCGAVCPDYHCQRACSRELFDTPINIPAVQATIIKKARDMGLKPEFDHPEPNGKRVGIIGGGPAGIAAAVTLVQMGYAADIYEPEADGGMCHLIPDERLDKDILLTDLEYLAETFSIRIIRQKIDHPDQLKDRSYDAIVIACGLDQPIRLNIPGDEYAHYGMDILRHPDNYDFAGKRVALVGGAIAADQALTIAQKGAAFVEMITLENYAEMPLTEPEKQGLVKAGVQFSHRMRIKEIIVSEGKVAGISQKPVFLSAGETFHPSRIKDEESCTELLRSFDLVVIAIGNRPSIPNAEDNYYRCGDLANGPTTVVEAAASGKNIALRIDHDLRQADPSIMAKTMSSPGALKENAPSTDTLSIEKATKSYQSIRGFKRLPVPLTTDFFGRKIISPFLLSAAPPSDGYEQMKKAYDAGWAGGVMKTAFDDLPIHIPGEYMFVFDPLTYA
ncbi:MAG: FAD-dependent oxidoreductase, partial [Candidatus Cloacimonetes bacterium]|nr:FAD-dependent oxidoreductase [Candidatus Cloacimonadota bacterium]